MATAKSSSKRPFLFIVFGVLAFLAFIAVMGLTLHSLAVK